MRYFNHNVCLRPPLEKLLSLSAYVFNHSNFNACYADGLLFGSTHNNYNKNYSILIDSVYEKLY